MQDDATGACAGRETEVTFRYWAITKWRWASREPARNGTAAGAAQPAGVQKRYTGSRLTATMNP